MHSAPLSLTTLQQLQGAIADALAQRMRDEAAVLGERREVAVLAVQVALPQSPGEEARIDDAPWVDEALRIILAVVHRYAGAIDSFEFNNILALFGVPFAHEDDAERAALAALAIQQAIHPLDARLRHQHNLTLILKIGLHIGQLIQGQMGFGELDYTLIGDTTQRVRRLQDAADDGAILASASIYERTKASFAYQTSQLMQGAYAEAAYLLSRAAVPASAVPRAVAQGAMIGRTSEFASLLAALDDMIREPCGRVALISGDAGIGKSRLIAEFCDAVSRLPVRWCVVSCSALNRVTPLFLAAGLLRTLFGITADLPATSQRELFALALSRLQLVAEDLLPYIEHVLSIRQATEVRNDRLRVLDPMMLQRQTHLALRQIVLAAAQTTPTVLVLEDLQWIDVASRDFFEYLIQTTRAGLDAHLMLVLVTRDRRPGGTIQPLIAAAACDPIGLLDIPLTPLSLAESHSLVDQLLHHPGEPLRDLLHQVGVRAAGNPLYIEELIQMLIEQGVLISDEQPWMTMRRAEHVLQHVPDTLQGLLAARFGTLPERMRRILQRNAVLGRSFPLRLLHQLEPGASAQLINDLDELVARQFLSCDPTEADHRYAFQSAMLQESIYKTLLLSDRQRLHSQAAQAIENDNKLSNDERMELLAYHYAESMSPLRALPYLIGAADLSARRYANETAIQHYRRALQLIGTGEYDPNALAAIWIGLGRTLKFNGQYVEATQILSTAVAALRNAGDGSAHRLLVLVEALRELAEVYQRDGTLDLAVTALTEGLALLQGSHAPAYRAVQRTLIDRLAAVRFRQGDLEAAYHLAAEETSAAALDENTDPVTLASLYNTLGGVFWQRGDLAEASQSVEQSLHLYERVSYSWGMATAYTNLGVLNYALGRWLQAVEQFQRSELLRKEIGYLPERAVNLKNLGVLQIEMGDHEQARQSLELSLAISRGIGDDYGIVVATLQLADLALLLQRVADARIHLDHAAHLLPAAGEDEQILFRWLIGLAAAAEGRCEEAITHVSEALELAVAAGVPELEIDCRRVLGALEGQRGALDAAERELQAALALSLEHASAFREGLAHYELGWQYLRRARQQTPADPVERERARASYQQALACFAALGARYAQQRAQSALLLLE